MKIDVIEGIVIRETNYSESSKILNVLTKDRGLIGVMSKGCRNMKNKLRGVSRKLIYGSFHIYYKENGLSTLIDVDVKNSYNNILSNFDAITYATYILMLFEQVAKQSNDNSLFDLLRAGLQKIDEGFNPLILTNIMELKCLNYLGVSPSIDCCSLCGDDKNILTLSSDHGGFICKNCHTIETVVKPTTIKLIRMFYYVDIDKITKLDLKDESISEINDFIDQYYDKYTGIYLRNKKNLLKVINTV
ncbi:MAG: DNA repair protein RecO [Bacilli bacterium]|nr:DNA repair protein RecO [Bacilli bacterium]